MATYQATLMHGERGGDGTYRFEGPDDLFTRSAMTILRAFMAHLEETAGLGHIDYHFNAAMKNKDKQVVTALGSLLFHGDDEQPFVCMIGPL